MSEETNTTEAQPGATPAGNDPTTTSPEEHAAASEGVAPGEGVSDPGVPDDVEVAARSADMDEPSMTHERIFVLGPNPYSPNKNPYTEAGGFDHEPNKAAVRQHAIGSGLWPTGDVAFKSAKKHADGVSWALTYSVPVVPAADAEGSPPEVVAADGSTEGAANHEPGDDEPTE